MNPIDILWKMIDEENHKDPDDIDCSNIEAWRLAIKRIGDEYSKPGSLKI